MECVGCGANIDMPAEDDYRWSVRTETVRGKERVVERHASLVCPACGVSEVWFYEDLRDDDGNVLVSAPWAAYNLVVEEVTPAVPLESYADGKFAHG